MLLRRRSRNLVILTLFTTLSSLASAFPSDSSNNNTASDAVEKRCAVPCGYYHQLCCQANQYCYTDANNEAQCGDTVSGGTPATGYSWVPAATSWETPEESTAPPLNCDYTNGQIACGNICCAAGQYCLVAGQCGTSGVTSYSAALRPTESTFVFVTQTIQPTTTVPFVIPVSTGGSTSPITISSDNSGGGGLSGGAIAGIVIGSILGALLLILLCLFLCFAAAWDALLAFFGFRKDRRRRTEEVYEYHRHGSQAGSRRWYGDRPPSQGAPPPPPPKKKGFFHRWCGVFAGLGGLAIALGLKRRYDRRHRDEKSEYTESTGYYSEYTSSSSDRRTRDTRRSNRL